MKIEIGVSIMNCACCVIVPTWCSEFGTTFSIVDTEDKQIFE